MSGWIGVDLDGTLAHADGPEFIGAPVPAMAERVKNWIAGGHDVRIFTARVSDSYMLNARKGRGMTKAEVVCAIERWCLEHVGTVLPVTNKKDFYMVEIWDDIAVRVERDTGRRLG